MNDVYLVAFKLEGAKRDSFLSTPRSFGFSSTESKKCDLESKKSNGGGTDFLSKTKSQSS